MIADILLMILNVIWWIIIVQAVLSWLIGFNVVNTSNQSVRQLWESLERLTDPIYRPIRRIMPNLGALDLSPLIVLLLLAILRRVLMG